MYDTLFVTVCGRLTGDPTEDKTKAGDAYVNFGMAVNHVDGTTTFASVSCFGSTVDIARTQLAKGSRVTIIGTAKLVAGKERTYLKVRTYSIFPGTYIPIESITAQKHDTDDLEDMEDGEYV